MMWRLIGPTWTFPVVEVSASGDVILVQPANIPTLNAQKTAVEAFLRSKSYKEAPPAFWLVRNELAKIALLFEGDPEEAVSWVPTPKHQISPDVDGMETMFHRISAGGWGSIPALKTLYAVFCRALLEQLVLRQQPVDLGFCKLHSLPLRANWKHVLMEMDWEATEGRQNRVGKRGGKVKRRIWPPCDLGSLISRRMDRMLFDNQLTGVKDFDLSRTIEVELKPVFKEALYERERQTFKPGKLRRAANEIADKTQQILRIYAAFVEASTLPYVLFREGELPKSGFGKWTGNVLEHDVPFDLDIVFSASGEKKSVQADLVDPDANVSEMSELLEERPDVRSQNSDLDAINICASTG